jgi:hypothetical protein
LPGRIRGLGQAPWTLLLRGGPLRSPDAARTGGYNGRRWWAETERVPCHQLAVVLADGRTEKWAANANHEASCFLIAQEVASGKRLAVWGGSKVRKGTC